MYMCYNNTIIFSQPPYSSVLQLKSPTWMENMQKKKFRKVPKNRTSIFHTLATVPILFTLTEALQVV